MRLSVLVGVWLSLVATSLAAKASEFSHSRDLPPLRLAATDLDIILHKAHSLVAGANGPPDAQEFIRESVKLGVRGKEIEIPHFSLASSIAFPKEVFRFAYTFYQPDKPISSVTLDFDDYSRRISVSGGAADQVEAISKILENDLLHYSTLIGGATFRYVAGVCLSVALLTITCGQQCILVEYSTLQRAGNAHLFGSWPSAAVARSVGQISSRLCSLPELFAFPSHQIRAADFFL